jgi:hypothetical protein
MLIRNLIRDWLLKNSDEMFNFHKDVQKAVNGGITFGVPSTVLLNGTQTVPQPCENINGVLVTVVTPLGGGTEFSVIHNLNRVPQLVDIKRMNSATVIFDSGTPWTKTQIFLKSTVGSITVTLHIH